MSIGEVKKVDQNKYQIPASQKSAERDSKASTSVISSVMGIKILPAALVTAITCLAFLLSFLYLGSKSLWFDESVSIGLARTPWPTFFHILTHGEANMSLYYFLLHFWANLGTSEIIIRSLSVLFAAATVPVIFAIGSRLFNKWVGLLAALFLTINPFFIHYAQEARGYSLVLFLVSLSSLIFIEAIRRPTKWLWVAYAVTSTLAMYAHLFAIFVLAGQVISLLLMRREKIPWRGLLISGGAIIVLILPLMVSIFTYSMQNLGYLSRPGLGEFTYVISGMAGGKFLLGISFVLGLIVLDFAIREWSTSRASFKTWRYGLLLSWLLVPIVISLGISQFKPIFGDRYFIICVAPLALLAAVGVSHIPRRWILALTILILLGQSLFQLNSWYVDTKNEDWRGATTYVLSNAERGDAVVFYTPYVSTPFDYYREKIDPAATSPVSVLSFDPAIYSTTPVLVVPEGFSVGGRMPPIDNGLLDRLTGYNRVWLVVSHDQYPQLGRDVQPLQDMLQGKYGTPGENQFFSIHVFLYNSEGF